MLFKDQRSDDHPEAVRSDPVPVPPPDPDAHDPDAHDPDAHDRQPEGDAAGTDKPGLIDRITGRADTDRDGVEDRAEEGADKPSLIDRITGRADKDHDGVPDRAEDQAAYTDTQTVDRDGDGVADVLQDRGTFDDPQVVDESRQGVDDEYQPVFGGEPDSRADADAAVDDHGTVDGTDTTDRTDADAVPVDNDRDGDGVDDRFDIDPTGPAPDTDRDGVPDSGDAALHDGGTFDDPVVADADRDGDGLPDREEDIALDDRGTFDDPVVASPVDIDDQRADDRPRDGEEMPFAEPAVVPTALGATTVGGAAAAAALAGDHRDARAEDTVAPGDGVVSDDGTVAEGSRASEMMPGDAPSEPVTAPVPTDVAQGFRDRWREVQLRFVDDPRGAAAEAQSLAEEAVDALIAALTAQKNDLGGWQATEAADTEQLRVVVRRYRDFLDRTLGS
jgi:hypothetical protein